MVHAFYLQNYLDLKSYDGSEYSGFVDDPLRQQATVL